MRIAVIGGGLGGLTATISLSQAGHEVTLFEQRERFTEVGCGISVWPNAMRALDELGLGAEVRAHGVHHCSGAFLTRAGERLFEPGARYFEAFGDTCVVHRKELVGILARAVPPEKTALGTKVTGVGLDGEVVADGERHLFDLVIGADGLHSVTRRALWPEARPPRYTGYSITRFVTVPLGDQQPRSQLELWGDRARFGYFPMSGGRAYCYGFQPAESGNPNLSLDPFRQFPAPVAHLLDSVGPEGVLQHDSYDLPNLETFVKGKVALLGDAAHAMTPNIGQGACQALEDAVTLARVYPDMRAYDRLRRRRTQRIARDSRRLGAMGLVSHPLLTPLRDVAMRTTRGMSLRQMDRVLRWVPPPPRGSSTNPLR
ncbi:FAD-dependent monooxygenase [Mycobacterium sp. D16Q16]|uniref:FAD-dependent monooxygenase n=1 Tax=Mycobacterium sp. D16Q16 TaxID=1855659 RepID=UPI000993CBA6|nr:FAD-dependent monooxygenase [Mycobacterium sp. D16Q16]